MKKVIAVINVFDAIGRLEAAGVTSKKIWDNREDMEFLLQHGKDKKSQIHYRALCFLSKMMEDPNLLDIMCCCVSVDREKGRLAKGVFDALSLATEPAVCSSVINALAFKPRLMSTHFPSSKVLRDLLVALAKNSEGAVRLNAFGVIGLASGMEFKGEVSCSPEPFFPKIFDLLIDSLGSKKDDSLRAAAFMCLETLLKNPHERDSVTGDQARSLCGFSIVSQSQPIYAFLNSLCK